MRKTNYLACPKQFPGATFCMVRMATDVQKEPVEDVGYVSSSSHQSDIVSF